MPRQPCTISPEAKPIVVEQGILFYLNDAEVRAREHPDSFFIPSAAGTIVA
jgi:hypothetical protein